MLHRKKRKASIGSKKRVVEHNGLYPYLVRYLEYRAVRGYTEASLMAIDANVRRFIAWCDERHLQQPSEITHPILDRYQRHLHFYRKVDGEPLSLRAQCVYLQSLRGWFKFLTRERYIPINPASEMELPRQTKSLPKQVLSIEQIVQLLQQPDIDTEQGVRDRAILETLYATGIRRSELANLKNHHVDLIGGTVFVNQGKGKKDRYVPLGERAIWWLKKYLNDVRPLFIITTNESALFLNSYGEAFAKNQLSDLVKRYLLRIGIANGSCHLFRHAMATHLLENGADIRFIQTLLGHSDLTSTAIYTQVALKKLKEVYNTTHPAQQQWLAQKNIHHD